MQKYLPYFMCLLFLVGVSLSRLAAQENRYHNIYYIQLMVAEQPIELPYLQDLGFVSLTSLERGPADSLSAVRVLLGPYLGELTADHVLHKVWEKGFEGAKLVQGPIDLQRGEGQNLTHTVQVGAFRRMHLEKYKQLSNLPAHGMYIVYEDGLFKVLSGLYAEADSAYLWNTVIPYYQKTMGLDGFVRRFR